MQSQGPERPSPDASESGSGFASTLVLVRKLLAIAGPVVLTQLGMMGFGLVDTLMLGRVGVAQLDAAALGNVWLWGTMMFAMGVVFGLDPIIAQAHGRGDSERTGLALQQGMVVAGLLSVPLIASAWVAEEVLLMFSQEPELARMAETYLRTQAWSLLPLLCFYVLRQYLQGRELVAAALWVTLLANVCNIVGNELLIFGVSIGGLELPAMGLKGAALASGITRACLAVGLVAWTWIKGLHHGAWQPWSTRALDPRGLLEVLRYGVPVGLQYTLEVWAFQASTLLAGELGRNALAAHTIVLNLASVTFMVPLGISFGVSTVIGNLLGSGRLKSAQRTAWIGFALGGGAMLVSACVLISLRHVLPGVYTDELAVLTLAAGILPIAAAFQLFDGLQVVGGGILRGTGDTLPAAVFNGVAYYGVALPLAAYFVLVRGAGLEAIWWSLALGLALVAGTLLIWVRRRGPAFAAEA
ncbi:Multi antimicrobial extrusion protein (Na(+)/drug antiporter) [Enhygromyxa salina]|uniref:Multidrug-efflux transporter n=1 Tax=Enhygromyxa salina TaxID=215803 RepID=A0A0C2A7E9_9BACT|nr:MATE family efflux transporter [Enhygromyxa salina]KIG19438.1 Multi antimicrobial extrusion protein (Na(+)/drug antiporter) [Enhygromyxa salina]